ncbi:MAG TPA: iron-molybdenum cofactor biosynthesis protein [Bacteroidetes bacterium]|nr:iron-molybdenum cofactor biosynthesis protein [Bacteroidota bacterium]
MKTRIAIATEDGTRLAQHFGRTPYFAVYTVENGGILHRELRENNFSPHMMGMRGAGLGHGPGGHGRILAALRDCDLVVSRGMGRRVYNDLRAAGIEMVITDSETVDEVIRAYLDGVLVDTGECCNHSHEDGHSPHQLGPGERN